MLKKFLMLGLAISLSTSLSDVAYSNSSNAVITSLHNRVQAKTAERPVWRKASLDFSLQGGDSLRTGFGSRAEVRYSDGTVSRVGSNTVIRVSEHSENRTDVKLVVGKLWLKVTKGNGRLKIQTPSAIASVLGTEVLVTNDENDVSHVTTLDGLVEVTSNLGDKQLVKPGEWVEIAPGKKMEKPTQFDWEALKKNERFVLDPNFVPPADDFKEDNSWK